MFQDKLRISHRLDETRSIKVAALVRFFVVSDNRIRSISRVNEFAII